MFNGIEYVRKVCKERKIPVATLEKECGFANGYLNPKKQSKLPYDRAVKIAEFLNLDANYLMTGKESEQKPRYYLNDDTAQTAQEMFEKDRVLFDVYQSDNRERLVAYAKHLKGLQDLEEGN